MSSKFESDNTREALRKEIARRLVERDPTLLTPERLDVLIEKIEREYDDAQHLAYLDQMDELAKLSDHDWIMGYGA